MKLPETLEDLKEMIDEADAVGACDNELNILRRSRDIKRLYAHPHLPDWLVWYARNVIKGRWPEAEELVTTDPYLAYEYALHVIKGRWIEVEGILATCKPVWMSYCEEFNINGDVK